MLQLLHKFFAVNRELCTKIEPYLPQAETDLVNSYDKTVAEYMNRGTGRIVVDIGGGRQCSFAKYRGATQTAKIIAVDVSRKELEYNTDVDEARIADASQTLPFENEEVDVIASRMVLEHLESVEGFVANSEQALKQGGYFIHLFPSRFAPFALVNRILPPALSSKALRFFKPKGGGSAFPAFYDNCCYSDLHQLLQEYNFEIVEMYLSYYQSRYFGFLLPLYLISAFYEILIQTLGAKNLAAYILVVAQRS